MTRAQKAMLFTIHWLRKLQDQRMLTGVDYGLSDKGREAYKGLLREGFMPTDEEFERCVGTLADRQNKVALIKGARAMRDL